MSEEVKPTGIGLTISNINHDMMVRKLQSERQARLDAETKLRELQDALEMSLTNHDPLDSKNRFESENICIQSTWGEEGFDQIKQAIQESRTRRQNDDTTI